MARCPLPTSCSIWVRQALGVIMAEQRCTTEQAFAILRTASQNRNLKPRQLAEDIVTRVTSKACTKAGTVQEEEEEGN